MNNIDHGQGSDIIIRRIRNWKRLGRVRGIKLNKLRVVTYGFYVSMVFWTVGVIISMCIQDRAVSILLIVLPLVIYIFFAIWGMYIEHKIRRNSQRER